MMSFQLQMLLAWNGDEVPAVLPDSMILLYYLQSNSRIVTSVHDRMVCHLRCVFINYVGLINCRTQLSGGRCMLFIT